VRDGVHVARIRMGHRSMIFVLMRKPHHRSPRRGWMPITVERNCNVVVKPPQVDTSQLQFRNIEKITAKEILCDPARRRTPELAFFQTAFVFADNGFACRRQPEDSTSPKIARITISASGVEETMPPIIGTAVCRMMSEPVLHMIGSPAMMATTVRG
jgi:hypothetical protein